MSYPEAGAKYKNEPAWFDRAKRAEGGGVSKDDAIEMMSYVPTREDENSAKFQEQQGPTLQNASNVKYVRDRLGGYPTGSDKFTSDGPKSQFPRKGEDW